MSLNDWNKYFDGGTLSSNPQGTAFTNILTPVDGTGSLSLSHIATTDFQSINLVPATIPVGFLSGRIRTLIRLDSFNDGGSPNLQENHAGILCLQNVENMAQFGSFGGTGQAYGASLTIGEGFSTESVRLWKFTDGLEGSGGFLDGTILDSVVFPFAIAEGDTIAIQLIWRADPLIISDLGGATFSVSIGQASDYSDLQEVITYVDTISPYTSTVAEGLFACFKNNLATFPNKVTFDDTYFYRTTIT